MKKLAAVVIAAVIAIAAAGCSADTSAQTQEVATSDAATTEPTPTAAALTSTPAATPEPTGFGMGDYTPDEFFIAIMDQYWIGDRPDDAALIGAGKLACEELTAGSPKDSVAVVEGDPENNARVVQYAPQAFCPEFF